MSEDRNIYERIEAYIKGELSSDERQQFEVDLKTDMILAEKYQLQLMEHEAMEYMVGESLKNKFSAWNINPPENPLPENVKTKISETKGYGRLKFIIGAFFLIALVTLLVFVFYRIKSIRVESNDPDTPLMNDSLTQWDNEPFAMDTLMQGEPPDVIPDTNSKDKPSKEAIKWEDKESSQESSYRYDLAYVKTAQEYYTEPEVFSTVFRSGAEEQPGNYSRALEMYQDKKYNSALNMLSGLELQSNSNASYLMGHIYFQLQRYKEAAGIFSTIANNPLLPVYEDAQWYLFLSYTAELPKSQKKWEAMRKELEFDPAFSYKNEFQRLVLEIDKLN